MKQSAKHMVKKISEIPNQKPRQLDRTVLEDPVTDEGVQVEISGLTVAREHSSGRRFFLWVMSSHVTDGLNVRSPLSWKNRS